MRKSRPATTDTADIVELIDAEITSRRIAMLVALDAGHDGEAEWIEAIIDKLLEQRAALTSERLAQRDA